MIDQIWEGATCGQDILSNLKIILDAAGFPPPAITFGANAQAQAAVRGLFYSCSGRADASSATERRPN
jgi:hypothetical protein